MVNWKKCSPVKQEAHLLAKQNWPFIVTEDIAKLILLLEVQ